MMNQKQPTTSTAQKAAAEMGRITRTILDMYDGEAERADALEAILQEAVECNFGPGEWQEKARRVVEGER